MKYDRSRLSQPCSDPGMAWGLRRGEATGTGRGTPLSDWPFSTRSTDEFNSCALPCEAKRHAWGQPPFDFAQGRLWLSVRGERKISTVFLQERLSYINIHT